MHLVKFDSPKELSVKPLGSAPVLSLKASPASRAKVRSQASGGPERFAGSAFWLDRIPQKRQNAVIFWVEGIGPLCTNVITPWMTRQRFRHSNLSPSEQNLNVNQEIARQVVSGGLHLSSFFGGGLLLGQLLGRGASAESKNMIRVLGGTVLDLLAYAFIRPLISSEIILRWLYPNAGHPKAVRPPIYAPVFSAFQR